MKPSRPNSLRIIGGQWRSRKLVFPNNPQLRPTSDRVRETLFNWLQNDIHGSRCLDLFAGSGALGLEALSRGASHCTFVETHKQTLQQLKRNLTLLNSEQAATIQMDGISYLQKNTTPFDIVFIDPPFSLNLWQPCLDLLSNSQFLSDHAKIYIESPSKLSSLNLAPHWDIHREKTAGDVTYRLVSLSIDQDN